MIKRYILHIEFHRGYKPRVSFKRVPRPGDRVIDGGVPGTLVTCKECGDGLLHQPDSFAGLWPEPPRPLVTKGVDEGILGADEIQAYDDRVYTTLTLGSNSLDYQVGEHIWYKNQEHIVDEVVPKKKLVLVAFWKPKN